MISCNSGIANYVSSRANFYLCEWHQTKRQNGLSLRWCALSPLYFPKLEEAPSVTLDIILRGFKSNRVATCFSNWYIPNPVLSIKQLNKFKTWWKFKILFPKFSKNHTREMHRSKISGFYFHWCFTHISNKYVLMIGSVVPLTSIRKKCKKRGILHILFQFINNIFIFYFHDWI